MARSVEEIYDDKIAERNSMSELLALQPSADSSQQLLSDLTTTSKVEDHRLWLFITCVFDHIIELLFDNHKEEVTAIVKKYELHNPYWYQQQCLAFQYGDNLQWIDYKFQYETVNESLKIIARAAVVEDNLSGQLIIKVAKNGSSGIEPLNPTTELISFTKYINQIKDAGVRTLIISNTPDLLKLYINAQYNPLLLNSDGSLISNSSVFPLEDAISSYFSNLEFNGKIVLTDLTDYMQQAEGIVNPTVTLAQAKFGSNSYANFQVDYQTDAGYIKIDPDFPLSNTISYVNV